jgi:hypothetical protein
VGEVEVAAGGHGAYSKNPSQGSSIYASPEMPGTVALQMRYKGQKPALLEERRI